MMHFYKSDYSAQMLTFHWDVVRSNHTHIHNEFNFHAWFPHPVRLLQFQLAVKTLLYLPQAIDDKRNTLSSFVSILNTLICSEVNNIARNFLFQVLISLFKWTFGPISLPGNQMTQETFVYFFISHMNLLDWLFSPPIGLVSIYIYSWE